MSVCINIDNKESSYSLNIVKNKAKLLTKYFVIRFFLYYKVFRGNIDPYR